MNFLNPGEIGTVDKLVNLLVKKPSLTPSIWCPYFTQHFMHRNKEMIWQKSHLEDLNHLAALPYVDYLSIDRQIYGFAMQASRFAKRNISADWNKKLIKSIEEISL
jgi:hypothetical protein